MRIRLAYGKTGLTIELPDDWDLTVIEPRYLSSLPNPYQEIQKALRTPIESPPLNKLVTPGDRVGVIFSDITRPTPNHLILPAVLGELAHVPKKNITLFNALGTHRANTDQELQNMLGDLFENQYRIVQNDAFNPASQVHLGVSSQGHDIWINRELTECDVIIPTGFIEPHFFAGFSGGSKAIMPGMAGQTTVLGNHDANNIGNPKATWGVTWGNPIWEEIREVAHIVGGTFLVNVALNKNKQVTGVFAGDLDKAYALGCEFVKEHAMVAVPHLFDIVITTNSGYPLDLNLYQSVKGMSAAAQAVKQGGGIIIAADCWDGIPEHGLYGQLLSVAQSPLELLDRICEPGFLEQDQWQAQIQAQIQLKASVYVYTENLTDAQISAALLRPCRSIEDTVRNLKSEYGSQATICVLPEGPQTIPYIKS